MPLQVLRVLWPRAPASWHGQAPSVHRPWPGMPTPVPGSLHAALRPTAPRFPAHVCDWELARDLRGCRQLRIFSARTRSLTQREKKNRNGRWEGMGWGHSLLKKLPQKESPLLIRSLAVGSAEALERRRRRGREEGRGQGVSWPAGPSQKTELQPTSRPPPVGHRSSLPPSLLPRVPG